MPTRIYEIISFSSSFFTIIAQETNSLPYLPSTLNKHPTWFFDDADLFLSHNEIIFGLHQNRFQSPYFSTIRQMIEPGQTTAIGTVPALPIPCDDISQPTLLAFILLRHHPRTFTSTRDNWLAIRSLALKWHFTQVIVRSLHEIKHFNRQRQSLGLAQPHFVNVMHPQRQRNQFSPLTRTDDDEESWELSA